MNMAIAAIPKSPLEKEIDTLQRSTAGLKADTAAIYARGTAIATNATEEIQAQSTVLYSQKYSAEMEEKYREQRKQANFNEKTMIAALNAAALKDLAEYDKKVAESSVAELKALFAKGGAVEAANKLYAKYFTDMSAGDKVQAEFAASSDAVTRALKQGIADFAGNAVVVAILEKALAKVGETAAMVADKFVPLVNVLEKVKQTIKDGEIAMSEVALSVARAGGGVLATFMGQTQNLDILRATYLSAQADVDLFTKGLDTSTLSAGENKTKLQELTAALQGAEKKYLDLRNSQDRSFGKGAQQAFDDYYMAATDLAAQSKVLFGSMYKNAEDALTTFITTGKLSFTSFVDSMKADLARMAAKQIVLTFLGVIGGVSGGRWQAKALPGQRARRRSVAHLVP
jgi:phage-related minor tail protein